MTLSKILHTAGDIFSAFLNVVPMSTSDKNNIINSINDIHNLAEDATAVTHTSIDSDTLKATVQAILPGVIETAVAEALSKLMPFNAPPPGANAGIGITQPNS